MRDKKFWDSDIQAVANKQELMREFRHFKIPVPHTLKAYALILSSLETVLIMFNSGELFWTFGTIIQEWFPSNYFSLIYKASR